MRGLRERLHRVPENAQRPVERPEGQVDPRDLGVQRRVSMAALVRHAVVVGLLRVVQNIVILLILPDEEQAAAQFPLHHCVLQRQLGAHEHVGGPKERLGQGRRPVVHVQVGKAKHQIHVMSVRIEQPLNLRNLRHQQVPRRGFIVSDHAPHATHAPSAHSPAAPFRGARPPRLCVVDHERDARPPPWLPARLRGRRLIFTPTNHLHGHRDERLGPLLRKLRAHAPHAVAPLHGRLAVHARPAGLTVKSALLVLLQVAVSIRIECLA